MLRNRQHWSYFHYVLIPSEPEHFCLEKLIRDAIPLLEAPPLIRMVHLYKLLFDGSFHPSHISKCFISERVLKAGNSKNWHGAVCGEFCGWRTCWIWCSANIGCANWAKWRGTLWFATQLTAISWSLRRTASLTSFTDPKYKCWVTIRPCAGKWRHTAPS